MNATYEYSTVYYYCLSLSFLRLLSLRKFKYRLYLYYDIKLSKSNLMILNDALLYNYFDKWNLYEKLLIYKFNSKLKFDHIN